jgi:hypothetical protein
MMIYADWNHMLLLRLLLFAVAGTASLACPVCCHTLLQAAAGGTA